MRGSSRWSRCKADASIADSIFQESSTQAASPKPLVCVEALSASPDLPVHAGPQVISGELPAREESITEQASDINILFSGELGACEESVAEYASDNNIAEVTLGRWRRRLVETEDTDGEAPSPRDGLATGDVSSLRDGLATGDASLPRDGLATGPCPSEFIESEILAHGETVRGKYTREVGSALHQDPKTGEWMQGPGIVDWGFSSKPCLDGEEGRHCDPWGPGESKLGPTGRSEEGDQVHTAHNSGQSLNMIGNEISRLAFERGLTSRNPSRQVHKRPTVRQGQGIEEALSGIGAQAGSRQERPKGEGYCPAGEANFRTEEARWTFDGKSTGLHEKPCTTGMDPLGVKEFQTAAQRRNQRRARRHAKDHDESTESNTGCVVLVRDDCRLHDNPALHAAANNHPWVLPLYIHDTSDPSPLPVRGAGLYWRHMSLLHYGKALLGCKGHLVIRKGRYVEEILDVLLACQATAVYFNRQLEPWYHQRDLEIQQKLTDLGFMVRSFKGLVLQREPWEVQEARPPAHLLTKYQGPPVDPKDDRDGRDDSVRVHPQQDFVEPPLPTVTQLGTNLGHAAPEVESLALKDLGYGLSAGTGMPPSASMRQYNEKRELRIRQGSLKQDAENDWAFEMRHFWQFGEKGGLSQLEAFLLEAAAGHYQPPERYRADKPWTALLSPYLRFGDLSPRYAYMRARQALAFAHWKPLVRRLFWRDGAYAQLYRWPTSPHESIRKQYETESWHGTQEMLQCWQRGQTGFPLIDAAMRQLWKVGWMPNYLRHVVAQFLIEYLDVDWKKGLQWFDYTLVDSDVAINAMMWQMGGHSGLGAWNFVMHPVFAGKKVDPEGQYVRRWLPELKGLPIEYIHCPWEAPCACLLSANVILSTSYRERVIEDLVKARKAHARNVIAVRQRYPDMVKPDGHEILDVGGQQITVRVRDDLKDNSEEISLQMTADEPHSAQRRRLARTKGIHHELLYEEAKKYEFVHQADESTL